MSCVSGSALTFPFEGIRHEGIARRPNSCVHPVAFIKEVELDEGSGNSFTEIQKLGIGVSRLRRRRKTVPR